MMQSPTCAESAISHIKTAPLGYKSNRNKEIFIKYHGLDGKGKKSMAIVGEEYGLGRERVRQIINEFQARLNKVEANSVLLEQLHSARRALVSRLPSFSGQLQDIACELGIIPSNKFDVTGLFRIFEIFSIEGKELHTFEYQKTLFYLGHDQRHLEQDILDSFKRLRKVTVKETSKNGAIRFDELINCKTPLKKDVRSQFVKLFIEGSSDVFWLDSGKKWVFRSDFGHNKALSRIKHVFSVFKKVRVADLTEGLRRSLMKGVGKKSFDFKLDNECVIALCSNIKGLVLDAGFIIADQRLGGPKFSRLEKEMVDLIRRSPAGELHEKTMEDEFVHSPERPENKYAFSMVLNYSPLIVRERYGVYRLTGELHTDNG